MDDEGAFLEQFLNWSIRHAKSDIQRERAWHVVAAVVNKRAPGKDVTLVNCGAQPFIDIVAQDLDAFLNTTFSTFWNGEIATSPDHDMRRRAISAWAWVRNPRPLLLEILRPLFFFAGFKGSPSQGSPKGTLICR